MAYQFMPMYNVDYPVGEPNDGRDVMLLKLLFMAYDQATQFHLKVANFRPHTGFQSNGQFHPRWADWITAFQSAGGGGTPQRWKDPADPSERRSLGAMTGGAGSTLAILNYNVLRVAPGDSSSHRANNAFAN